MAEQQQQPNRRLWRELRLARVGGSLLVTAIPLAFGITAALIVHAEVDLSDAGPMALIVAYPLALAVAAICICFHLVLIRIRREVTRRQCLVWGVATAILAELSLGAIASLAEDGLGDAYGNIALNGLILLALFFLPAGLLSGWIYWRIGIRPRPRAPDNVSHGQDKAGDRFLTPRHRRWRDLHGGRLTLGLSLGPIVMTALLALIWIVDGSMTTAEMIRAGIATLIFVLVWCLVCGWIYLLLVVRRRRRIGRFECLLLGVIIADLFPLALAALMFGIEGWGGIAAMVSNPGADASYAAIIFLAVEVLFTAMGVLSGWLFWRLGVRPAPLPHPDVSAVFD